MNGTNSTAQGVYTPLPQTISDTESEEDTIIHTTKLSGVNNTTTTTNSNKMYRELDEGDDQNVNYIPNVTIQDNLPIIKADKNGSKMSPLRKLCFMLSILLCFITIIVFLWLLPCDEILTCPATVHNSYTSNWEKTYHGIELKSSISVVSGVNGRSRNLVFLFRGDIMNLDSVQEFPYIPAEGGGLIAIVGSSGKVAWFIRLNRIPSDIDCNLIDVDQNGIFDCLVVGELGLLEVVNPVSGTVLWRIHHTLNSTLQFTSIDFPLLLPDMNSDGVFDMVTSCSINGKEHNVLIIISGKTGTVIGRPWIISECKTIHKLAIDKNNLISYICQNVTFKELDINLNDLYRIIANRTTNWWDAVQPVKQHLIIAQKQNTESQRNIYTIHNRKLIVQNDGNCPGNCNVTVQLIDMQSGKENLTWSHTGTNMYGMIPAILEFNNTKENQEALKGHLSGFILKFWQWNLPKKYKNDLSVTNYSRKMNWRKLRRSLPNFNKKSDNVTVQLLTERVVLITFNSTDLHIVNASQNEITQLCTASPVGYKLLNCQPNLNYQENSVLISNWDQDDSKELISYLSTYVNVDEYTSTDGSGETLSSWQLQSIVKIVRLEAELPKLYEAVSKY